MILTGSTAALFFRGVRIGCCRSLSLNIDREALQTTKQGDTDRTYLPGLRGTSGSASVFYDPEDAATASLLTSAYEDSTSLSGLVMVFDAVGDRKVTAEAVLTQVGVSVGYGAAQVCEVQFQISGKPAAAF